jgi:hypothetical protein
MATFRSKSTVQSDIVRVEIGSRSNAPAFKVMLPGGMTFILTEAEAYSVADTLDQALDLLESDPLLWENGSQ